MSLSPELNPSQVFDADTIALLAKSQSRQVLAIFRRMGLGDVADDLLQDTMEKALKSIKTFRGEALASTWLHRVAQTVALDFLRKKKRSPQVFVDTEAPGVMEFLEGVDEFSNPESLAIARQRGEQIELAFSKLSPEVRAALATGDVVNVSQAAKALGTPSSAIHSRVSRLRKKLSAD